MKEAIFLSGMAVLFVALFVVNVCSHGTALGLIGTGGLAVLMGFRAYRTWCRGRSTNHQAAILVGGR